MSAADYAGRRYDVLAFHGDYDAQARASGNSLLSRGELEQALIPLDGSGGYIVAGVGKLVQNFLLVLLLVRGTKANRPDDGCEFVSDARLGTWRTAADVQQSFYSALSDVRRQLQLTEDDDTPDDERFAGAELEDVVFAWPAVALRVSISSQAGSSRQVLLPLSVVVFSEEG